jgi:hypothetical protein
MVLETIRVRLTLVTTPPGKMDQYCLLDGEDRYFLEIDPEQIALPMGDLVRFPNGSAILPQENHLMFPVLTGRSLLIGS